MIVVDFTFEYSFRRVDDPVTACEHSIDALARMVPERKPYCPTFAIGPSERSAIQFTISHSSLTQESDLLLVEQVPDKDKSVTVVCCQLFVSQCWHMCSGTIL